MPTIRLKALLSGSKPGAPEKPAAAPKPADPPAAAKSGRVVHDERGNAVWDWLAKTGRNAVESTSALLKKLEAPELSLEDSDDRHTKLELEDKPCAGGGYDPYGKHTPSRPSKPLGKPGKK